MYICLSWCVDNVLYSWGIGDKGQLGTSLPDGRKTVLLPRPVFGSLYSIPELSCRHWHTIMIAGRLVEKLLYNRLEYMLGNVNIFYRTCYFVKNH